MIALTYLALTCLYIQLSTRLVASMTGGSVARMEQLEREKGFAFMFVTATGFYFAVAWVVRKISNDERALHEAHERWMEAERQAGPALLAASIAHDVANLLTILRLNLESLKRDTLPESSREPIARLDRGTDRLTELVKRLRGASTSLFGEAPTQIDVAEIVRETLSLMKTHTCCEKLTVELVDEPPTNLRGYAILIHQLVMNLMINAGEALKGSGRVRIQVRGFAGGVGLVVEDNGPGVEPSLREKVLSPFFTTKVTGSGLGLTSVRSCVDIHQGTVDIADSPMGGAMFTIRLPDLSEERWRELRAPNGTQLRRPVDAAAVIG